MSPSYDRRTRRSLLGVSVLATGLGMAVALVGRAGAVPAAGWPRFWATVFFVVLLWPVGLTLLGRALGRRAQLAGAGLLLLLTVAQQGGYATVDVPDQETNRWWATLATPGDAIRHRIPLPAPESEAWARAWGRSAAAVLHICTAGAVDPETAVSVTVAGESPDLLARQRRLEAPGELGWYAQPVSRSTVERAAAAGQTLDVTVRRGAASGPPVRLCGGRDDPARPGAGGSERLRQGHWSGAVLADAPFPPVGGRAVLGRYFVELRFLDDAGRPSVAIWY